MIRRKIRKKAQKKENLMQENEGKEKRDKAGAKRKKTGMKY